MSAHSTGSKKRKTSAEPSSPPETKKARSSDVDGDVEVESAGEAVVLGMPIDPPTQPVASSSSGTSLAAPISPGQENTNGTGNGNGLTEGANKEEIMAKDGFTVVKRDKGKDKKQKKLEKARLVGLMRLQSPVVNLLLTFATIRVNRLRSLNSCTIRMALRPARRLGSL